VEAGNPFSSFGLEQQAQIVQDWYVNNAGALDGAAARADPRFRYIEQNIRAGQP
jgi:hypothetical protein